MVNRYDHIFKIFKSDYSHQGERVSVMYAELARELENLGKRIEDLRVSL